MAIRKVLLPGEYIFTRLKDGSHFIGDEYNVKPKFGVMVKDKLWNIYRDVVAPVNITGVRDVEENDPASVRKFGEWIPINLFFNINGNNPNVDGLVITRIDTTQDQYNDLISV